MCFSILNVNLEASLQGLGRPSSVLAVELVGLGVTVVLLLLLLPCYNIIGAAVASLLS